MEDNETFLETEEQLAKERTTTYANVMRDRRERGIPPEGWKRWREKQATKEEK